MRTLFIFDSCGELPLQFFFKDGDYTHLNGIYINSSEQDENLQEELNELLYTEEGEVIPIMTKEFPLKDIQPLSTKVVIVGFMP